MKQSQQQNQKLQQKQGYFLSQQHLKLMHLMHLSGFALQEFITNEVEQNPALESDIENDSDVDIGEDAEEQVFDPEFYNDDDFPERNYSTQPANYSYEAPVIQFDSLQENLKEQVRWMHLPERISKIACYLIDELEDDGYLRRPLSEVCFDYGFSNGKLFDENNFSHALTAIQKCEPAGIGARDLRECLLLQLRSIQRSDNDSFHFSHACLILENHFELFLQRKFEKIKTALNTTESDLKKTLQIIKQLNPKPVVETNKYELMQQQIIPDFEVAIDDDQLYVSLTHFDAAKLRVNSDFENLMYHIPKSEKQEAQNYFMRLTEDAQSLVDALKERETSMLKVISVIVNSQTPFFKTGDFRELKPMILHDVAHATGYDVSTISRITSNKYVQTPFGIFALKNLFMRNINPDPDLKSQHTSITIQSEIKRIIDNEDKTKPLSDNEITKLLEEQEMSIARRTVVKYRNALGIPNSDIRKH